MSDKSHERFCSEQYQNGWVDVNLKHKNKFSFPNNLVSFYKSGFLWRNLHQINLANLVKGFLDDNSLFAKYMLLRMGAHSAVCRMDFNASQLFLSAL